MKYLLLSFIILITCNAQAQTVPATLSYQGIILQNDGITPLADGAHSIVFNFYTASTGGAALFTRTISVTTAKGLYTSIIGGGTGANAPFNTTELNQLGSQQLYIGIKVDGSAELTPRAQLTTTPYAVRSESLTNTASATGGNIAFWGANNTVGADGNLFWNNVNKRLGVGTVAPNQKLSISGGIGFANFNDTDKKLYSPVDGTLEWQTNNFAPEHGFAISNQGTRHIYLNSNGNTYFNGGNVGIGTATPSTGLSVQTSMNVDNANVNGGASVNPGLIFGGSGSLEGIASKRTAGGNQNGLDFYTGGLND